MDKKEDGGVNHMPRKRVTQIFPFLLPLRRWQRKKFFYYKMRKDGCRYAGRTDDSLLPDLVFPYCTVRTVNTIPGFTSHSRYPNMMKGIGLSFLKVLDKLTGLYLE